MHREWNQSVPSGALLKMRVVPYKLSAPRCLPKLIPEQLALGFVGPQSQLELLWVVNKQLVQKLMRCNHGPHLAAVQEN
jgi:hypothetical protein